VALELFPEPFGTVIISPVRFGGVVRNRQSVRKRILGEGEIAYSLLLCYAPA